MLPLRDAARTAAAASLLSRAATHQVTARTAEQLFTTLGELKGGAAKLGQTMSVFEAAMPEEVAAPYRSALRRLTDAARRCLPRWPAGWSPRTRRRLRAGLAGSARGLRRRPGRGGLDRPGAPRTMADRRRPSRAGGGEGAVPGGGSGAALRPSPGPAAGAGGGPADQTQRVRPGGRTRQAHRRGAGLRARGAGPGRGRGRVRGPPADGTRRRPRRRGTRTAGPDQHHGPGRVRRDPPGADHPLAGRGEPVRAARRANRPAPRGLA